MEKNSGKANVLKRTVKVNKKKRKKENLTMNEINSESYDIDCAIHLFPLQFL